MLEQDAADLVITASVLEDNDTGFLIQEMRHQRLGPNPFIIVIMLLADADPDSVRKAIDSGTDDLLLMPVSPEQVFGRIEKLAKARKPFVVTHDYIGPDRRTKTRQFENSAPSLPAPNLLKARMQAGMDGTRQGVHVRDGAMTVNRMKIERDIVQMNWLANHVGAIIRDGSQDASLPDYAGHLVAAAEDVIRRTRNAPAETDLSAATELLDLARRLEADPAQIGFSDLQKLADLPKRLATSLDKTKDARRHAAP